MSALWSEFMRLFNTNPPIVSFILGVTALTWGVVSFVLGTWFGHWLARSRDKRKEFNAVADPLFLLLDKFMSECREGKRDYPRFTEDDFRLLRVHVKKSRRENYQRAVSQFFSDLKDNEIYDDGRIHPSIKSPEKLIPSLKVLLIFVGHK
ncbi:hypothetical protein [Yersinia hibernica]|uniref:hypothetical protein n=1 Tax=Yersinia hibernica TaxID=2339259 RepID=UPI001878851C|nr:hypothetical protein [Yersinia hibernica]